jgi:hypothetical protein
VISQCKSLEVFLLESNIESLEIFSRILLEVLLRISFAESAGNLRVSVSSQRDNKS